MQRKTTHFPLLPPDFRYAVCQVQNEQANHMSKNRLKAVRESLLMSKAELARKANVSPMTIARIEKGAACRLETKRKIILALGLTLADKKKIFQD